MNDAFHVEPALLFLSLGTRDDEAELRAKPAHRVAAPFPFPGQADVGCEH